MDLLRRAYRRVPAVMGPAQLPTTGEKRPPPNRFTSRLAFFRRPLRLKGNSSISVPLGVVVLFPCIVVVLILVLFVRHPSSPGRILMPAGAPPAIRYVFYAIYISVIVQFRPADYYMSTEKSAKSTTKYLSLDVSSPTRRLSE